MASNGTTHGTGAARLVGVVAAVNPKGIRLDGRDDWLNFSKFAADLVAPSRGQAVSVTLDGQGFVRAIGAAGGVGNLPTSGVSTIVDTGAGLTKDTLIIRQCVIKAAAEFCASRPELRSTDLLALAERMEAWVLREGACPTGHRRSGNRYGRS